MAVAENVRKCLRRMRVIREPGVPRFPLAYHKPPTSSTCPLVGQALPPANPHQSEPRPSGSGKGTSETADWRRRIARSIHTWKSFSRTAVVEAPAAPVPLQLLRRDLPPALFGAPTKQLLFVVKLGLWFGRYDVGEFACILACQGFAPPSTRISAKSIRQLCDAGVSQWTE
jgi:hypothetical protein